MRPSVRPDASKRTASDCAWTSYANLATDSLTAVAMTTLQFTSDLSATAGTVWAHAISPAGINRELAPLMRMTFPSSVAALSEDTVEPGRKICTSWFLLFGFLPIDRAEVTLQEIGPGRRFAEQSPLHSMRVWRHARSVFETDRGCVLEDVVTFEPRLALLRSVARWTVGTLFTHRHRRLRSMFG